MIQAYFIGLLADSLRSVGAGRLPGSMPARLALALLVSVYHAGATAQFDHGEWDSLLRRHVVVLDGGHATAVDYDGMAADRTRLQDYLAAIAAVPRPVFETWSHPQQLAFLVNTYNAWTVEVVLGKYPELDSIRDIGFLFNSPWRRKVVALFGEQVSLDEVEHGMIRGWDRYREPRIHFAVNCAAVGCPALRAEAYTGAALEHQLQENTRLFLADRSRNRYSEGRLYVSRIFDWYEEDFQQGWGGVDSVAGFLQAYSTELGLDAEATTALRENRLRIRYLRYDWSLNKS